MTVPGRCVVVWAEDGLVFCLIGREDYERKDFQYGKQADQKCNTAAEEGKRAEAPGVFLCGRSEAFAVNAAVSAAVNIHLRKL